MGKFLGRFRFYDQPGRVRMVPLALATDTHRLCRVNDDCRDDDDLRGRHKFTDAEINSRFDRLEARIDELGDRVAELLALEEEEQTRDRWLRRRTRTYDDGPSLQEKLKALAQRWRELWREPSAEEPKLPQVPTAWTTTDGQQREALQHLNSYHERRRW